MSTATHVILALIYATLFATDLIVVSQRNKARQERDLFKQEVAEQTKRAEEAEARAIEADARVERSDRRVGELVTAITPLIEKTDWMSGRWKGQFDTLVALEQKRNNAVVVARKALWDIPLVGEHTRSFDGWTKLPDHRAVQAASTRVTEAAAEVGRVSSGLADRLAVKPADTTTQEN